MIHLLEQLTKLADAGKRLSNVGGRAELYTTTFDLIEEIFAHETSALLLLDPDTRTLSITAARGYSDDAVNTFRADIGVGITGLVAQSGKAQLITETVTDNRYVQGVIGGLSEMSVPLRAGKDIIGVLDMESTKTRFTSADLTLFSTFGEQVATAIRNLQLQSNLEERASRLVAIAKAGQSLTQIHDIDELLSRIIKLTINSLNLDTCAIQLWDEGKDNLVVTAAHGYDSDVIGLTIPKGQGVTGKVADLNRPSIVPDVTKTEDYIPGLGGCRSEMAVPLVFRDEVIGVLNAEHQSADRFNDTDLVHAAIFADQAASAIGNSRIRTDLDNSEKELGQFKKRLDLLSATSVKVNSIASLDELLDKILEMARTALGFHQMAVLLPEAGEKYLKVHRAQGYADGTLGRLIPVSESVTGRAFCTGQSQFVEDTTSDPNYIHGVDKGNCEIAVPLLAGDEVVGVLDAESAEGENFIAADQQVLEMMAAQVSSAVRNARQREVLSERNRRLTLIHRAACSLNMTTDPENMLDAILKLAQKALGFESVAILTPDKDNQYLTVRKSLSHGDVEGLRVEIGKGFVGSMFVSGEAGLISDISEYEDYIQGTEGARCEMAAPISIGGDIIGVLDAEALDPYAFSQADLDLLRIFASQTATALRNARMINDLADRSRRLTMIHRAACSLNVSDDPEVMLENILKLARKALGFDSVAILTPDRDGEHLTVRKALNHGDVEGLRIKIGEGFCGTMYVDGEPRIIHDIRKYDSYISGTDGALSEMAAPISIDGETIGILDAEAMEPGTFSDADLDMLRIFASQTATALRNAAMINDLADRSKRLTMIHKAACSLNVTDNPEQVLENILSLARKALGFESVAILMPSGDRTHLTVRKAINHGDVEGLRVKIGEGICGTMYVDGQARIIDDVAKDETYIPATVGARSEMAVPISLDGEIVGILDAEALEPNAFSQADMDLFRVFGSQTATALNNVKMINQLKNHTRRLNALNKSASALTAILDAGQLIDEILKLAKDALDLERCALLLVSPETRKLTLNSAIGYGKSTGMEIPLGKGITGITAVCGEPILIRDTADDERYVNAGVGGRCEMAVPLRVHGEIIGVLDTESPIPNIYDEQDLELFRAFASQAALAIHNARLFSGLEDANQLLSENVEEMARLNKELEDYASEIAQANKNLEWQIKNLTTVHEAGKTITASLDLDTTLDTILAMTSKIMGSTAGAIKLIDAETKELKIKAESGAITDISSSFSIFDMPLKIGDKTIGSFELVKEASRGIGKEERRMLETMASQAAIAIENARLFEDTQRIYYETLKSLAKALEARDDYTRGHSERVANLSQNIGKKLGLPEKDVVTIYNAALLHDIGKIGIRDEILLAPRGLSKDEMDIIRKHPTFGNTILMPLKFLGEIREFVRFHHERWDGTGYPDGRKGTDIPLASRIIAVADTFDAMTSSRPYRQALSKEIAIKEIAASANVQFDPLVVEAFLKIVQ